MVQKNKLVLPSGGEGPWGEAINGATKLRQRPTALKALGL